MSPNGDDINKEYGGHKYDKGGGTFDCEHGCECWMGDCNSGGPAGLDPGGMCPNNPKDGKRLGGKRDYELVVKKRIDTLGQRAYEAENLLKQVNPGTIKLAEELASVKKQLSEKKQRIRKATEALTL